MNTKQKISLISAIMIALILGEIIFFKLTIHPRTYHTLVGTVVPIVSRKHVPDGTTIAYNSNPPAGGRHYAVPQDAGIYVKAPADGHLVHSLEHGAIILWYNPQIVSPTQLAQLTEIFKKVNFMKKIMTPRNNLPVPIALSSWGRVEKFPTINEKQMRLFFETNYDQAPEQAPI